MITSTDNPLIKEVLKLQQKAGERRKTGLFVAEGRREVSLALQNRIKPSHLLLCPEIFSDDPGYPIDFHKHADTLTKVSASAYNKIAYRTDSEGVVLVGHQHMHTTETLTLPENALILVLEGIEKPGNLGAILRTADAAGVDAIVLANVKTDIHNPNVIRSSLGCLFTLQIATGSTGEVIRWIQAADAWPGGECPKVVAAALQTDRVFYNIDMRGPTALVFGTEDEGLSQAWREISGTPVRIPMMGTIDSLNVSVSVAILTYEAVRQRYGS